MTQTAADLAGRELPPSRWVLISQEMVDHHARTTGDDDWIHTSPERAADGPTGGTIAQGFLLLSLLSTLHYGRLPDVEHGAAYVFNYGLDRVRFVRPVRTERSVRAVTSVRDVTTRPDGRVVVSLDVALEVDDDDPRPAVVAEWLFLAAPEG